MKKLLRTIFFLTSLVIFHGTFIACSDGDSGGNDKPIVELTTTTYTGTFSVGGTAYKTLKMASNGTYTMKSSDGGTDDSGTYILPTERAVSNGTYIFYSKTAYNGKYFYVVVSDTGIVLQSGTVDASGNGTLRTASDESSGDDKNPQQDVQVDEITGKEINQLLKTIMETEVTKKHNMSKRFDFKPTSTAPAEGLTTYPISKSVDAVIWLDSDSESIYYYAAGYTDSNKKIPLPSDSSEMFSGTMTGADYMNLRTVDLTGFDGSTAKSLVCFFAYNINVTSIDFTGFDTSNVTNMSQMFDYCRNLQSLDVSGFDTSKVTSMYSMFSHCEKLTVIDVSHFDTSKVTDMGAMFSSCLKLASLDMSNFDTSKSTGIYSMFKNCSELTTLDLSSFDTSNVTSMRSLVNSCAKLTTIYVSEKFVTTKVEYDSKMFTDCTSLVGGSGTVYDAAHVDKAYAHIDGGTSNPGYFTAKDN